MPLTLSVALEPWAWNRGFGTVVRESGGRIGGAALVARGRSRGSVAQRGVHELLGLGDDLVEVVVAAERLGVDLVDVLGA